MQRATAGSGKLIFQHIPKTAGTTLSFILKRYFDKQDIYHVRNLQQMRGPSYSPHFGSLEQFENLSPEERNRFRLILGHMHFGIHRHIDFPCTYITFIRDPLERVISQFGQYKRMVKAGDLKVGHATLEAFLENQPRVMNNHQTRFISGLDIESHPPRAVYDKALENIENHFSLVGAVERFDESLLLLSHIFGWPNVHYVKRNIGIFRPPIDKVAEVTTERIIAANQLDANLYRHVVRLLDEKIEALGDGFGKELKRFRQKQVLNEKTRRLLIRSRDIASALLPGSIKRLLSKGRIVKQ